MHDCLILKCLFLYSLRAALFQFGWMDAGGIGQAEESLHQQVPVKNRTEEKVSKRTVSFSQSAKAGGVIYVNMIYCLISPAFYYLFES